MNVPRWIYISCQLFLRVLRDPFGFVESPTWKDQSQRQKFELSYKVFLFSLAVTLTLTIPIFLLRGVNPISVRFAGSIGFMSFIEFLFRGYILFLLYRFLFKAGDVWSIMSIYFLASVMMPIAALLDYPANYLMAKLADFVGDPQIEFRLEKINPDVLISFERTVPPFLRIGKDVGRFLNFLAQVAILWALATIYAKALRLNLFKSFLCVLLGGTLIALSSDYVFLPIFIRLYAFFVAD